MNNETVKQVTIKELYDLTETAAKPLLESVTYPWEALPKIKDFIIELGNSLDPEEYEKRVKISGFINQQLYLILPILQAHVLLEKIQRSDSVHLFVEVL